MALKGVGLRVLRWVIWLVAAFVLLRGIGSFFRTSLPVVGVAEAPAAAGGAVAEPAGLRAFPAMFAREYLTWRPGGASERAGRLKPYLAKGMEPQAGWTAGKENAGQTATGAWVYSFRPVADGRWLATVAVLVEPYETVREADSLGADRTTQNSLPGRAIYLDVPVGATAGGGWAVYDYPSLAAPPASGGELSGKPSADVQVADDGDRAKTLVNGFFRSYLGGTGGGEYAYFMAPGAKAPANLQTPWTFDSVAKVTLAKSGPDYIALADVVATDPATGAKFTNRYTLTLAQKDGRWLIKDLAQKGD